MPNAGNRAVVLDYEDLLPERRGVFAQYASDGWLLFAHAWRPEIARGAMTLAAVQEQFGEMRAQLAVDIELACCPHDAGPPICWCRKPLPGSVLEFAIERGVALERSIIVGSSAADRTMAQRLGVPFRELDQFFTKATPIDSAHT
jgi:D-glycero-D-manno-heptose 1,7-bisphosphate phosphatase